MELRDAHCHYQFAEVPYAAVEQARVDGVGQAMINGSAPSDWADVAALGRRDPRNRVSFGLHPWDVPTAPAGWEAELRAVLLAHPTAGVGEMGLDRWVKDHDPVAQEAAFRTQLALAVELDRALTIHCVKAIGPLMDILRATALRGAAFSCIVGMALSNSCPSSRGSGRISLSVRTISFRARLTSAFSLPR